MGDDNKFSKDRILINSVALLVLTVFAGFIGETTSCKLQTFFKDSMVGKHFVVFMLIYFTFSISHQISEEPIPPSENLKNSLIIYVFYLLFSKIHIKLAFVVMILMFLLLLNKDYVDYYSKIENKKDEVVKFYDTTFSVGYKVLGFLLIFGFILYFFDKRREYKKNFDYSKFLFGKVNCRNN